MLPVFRLRDGGYKNLKNNFSTFAACYVALAEKKTIMILAEGNTKHEKRLRPLQKGAARIALGALDESPDLNIAIVPVGVNFTYADRFRSDVMIDFGEPIEASDFFPTYQENPNKGIGELTKSLREGLEKSIIIIEDEADENICEDLFILSRSNRQLPHWPVITNSDQPLQAEKQIADRVNKMTTSEKQSIRETLLGYFDLLKKLQIKDKTVIAKAAHFFQDGLILLLGLLPFLVGYLFNYLPLRMARFVVDTQVKAIEFYSPVMLAVSIGTTLIYFLIWLVLVLVFFSWELLIFVVSLPFLGLWALYYLEITGRFRQSWRWRSLKPDQKKKLTNLRSQIALDY